MPKRNKVNLIKRKKVHLGRSNRGHFMAKNDGLYSGDVPKVLLVVPTVDVIVFPKMVVPLLVSDKNIISSFESDLQPKYIGLVGVKGSYQDASSSRQITYDDLFEIGTLGKIIKSIKINDFQFKILVQGVSRVKFNIDPNNDFSLVAGWQEYDFNLNTSDDELISQISQIQDLSSKYKNAFESICPDFDFIVSQIRDPERLADFLINNIELSPDACQRILEKKDSKSLLEEVLLNFENYLKEKEKDESGDFIKNSMHKVQREYYLREQLKTIKKELGEIEDSEDGDLRDLLSNAKLSKEAREEANRQIRRLEKMSPDSLESIVIRNHLEWLAGLPWGKYVNDEFIDIKKSEEILNKGHFGLKEVKERILDYLSIKHFRSNYNSQILCLAGPPGVGKTSIGRSIANALGRKFARISLGGVHDESEIRGHRRTYVGALPGRVIQSIKKAGSANPVIMIDEIDKLGVSGRGDPAAAMLEVLDPEQNSHFYDNYLGVHFDLSSVMFVATCNDVSAISGPLRDRMDVVYVPGYTSDEKVNIARDFLIPKIKNNLGLADKKIDFQDDVIREMINYHTRESGVRELERVVRKACSKYARNLIDKGDHINFSAENISNYIGPQILQKGSSLKENKVGVTNGLAWTLYGGDILQVEAILMPGKGNLMLTGKLGEVMKESAQAAISYVRSRSKQYGIDPSMFENHDLHIHLPAGAIPKDGPSAGVTLLSSVLSVFTQRPINAKCAMTGELNLQGNVLPIGGLKEKILAAIQNNLECVIIPEANRKEIGQFDSIFDSKKIELLFVKTVDEIIDKVLV